MNHRQLLAAAAGLLLAALPASAQSSTWTIDKNHSQAGFIVRHLGVSNVHGAISGITGTIVWDEKDPSKSSVNATLDATTVNTNNETRDKHLKSPDFFNVEKNPTLIFKSTSVTSEGGKLKINGDLTLAGVTKPVTLDVDGPSPPQKGQGGKLVTGFEATGIVKRSDFNFGSKFPAAMLGDDIKFTIDAEASKN
jgi:polyisoprenoid-binding protein YceI